MIISKLYEYAKRHDKKEELAYGLVYGLVGGLGYGLVFGLAYIFPIIASYPLLNVFIAFFVALEVFFWLDRSKPSKKESRMWSRMWFTVWKKIESGFDVLMLVGGYGAVRLLYDKLPEYWQDIERIMGWFGVVVVGALLLYGYVKINSLRYEKRRKK